MKTDMWELAPDACEAMLEAMGSVAKSIWDGERSLLEDRFLSTWEDVFLAAKEVLEEQNITIDLPVQQPIKWISVDIKLKNDD